jgi:hypothetical protein
LFQYYPMYGTLEVPVQRFAEVERDDLYDRVRAAFQALTANRLSRKNLQVPVRDVVANWGQFADAAVPVLRAARREVDG